MSDSPYIVELMNGTVYCCNHKPCCYCSVKSYSQIQSLMSSTVLR